MLKPILIGTLLLASISAYADIYCPATVYCSDPHAPWTCKAESNLPNLIIAGSWPQYETGPYYFVKASWRVVGGAKRVICTYLSADKIAVQWVSILNTTYDKTPKSYWHDLYNPFNPKNLTAVVCYSDEPQDCPLVKLLTPINPAQPVH